MTRVDHGRHSGEEGNFLEIAQKVHDFIDIKTGDLDLGGATEHSPVQHHDVSVDMEVRQNGDHRAPLGRS